MTNIIDIDEMIDPAVEALSDDEYLQEVDRLVEGLERLKSEAHELQDLRGVPRSDFRGLDLIISCSKHLRERRSDLFLEIHREDLVRYRALHAGFLYGIDSAEFETALRARNEVYAARMRLPPHATLPITRDCLEHSLSYYPGGSPDYVDDNED